VTPFVLGLAGLGFDTEIRGPYYSVGEHILLLVSHGANQNQVMGKRYLAVVWATDLSDSLRSGFGRSGV
jgi:hypothetical protein